MESPVLESQVFGGEHHTGRPARPLWNAMWNGFRGKCPKCGEGKLFSSFVKTVDRCEHCGEEMHHHRADDLPAYLVVLVVGHIMVGAVMGFIEVTSLSTWQILAIWGPMTVIMAVGLLRPVKGAVVGLQWALYMHGFGGEDDGLETHPEM